jgi:hypothetical protein
MRTRAAQIVATDSPFDLVEVQLDKLIRACSFKQIEYAARDAESGRTIKPVLQISES